MKYKYIKYTNGFYLVEFLVHLHNVECVLTIRIYPYINKDKLSIGAKQLTIKKRDKGPGH